MKAMLSTEPGGPETLVLTEMPTPEPKSGDIRIAVKAAGVNFPDTLIIRDLYQIKPPRPFAPGGEIAGVVDALGDGVEGFSIGDRVLAVPGVGGFVSHLTTPAARVIKIPDTMPYDEAACFIFTYGTSHYALRDRAALKAGETLLILGAAGGVGAAAIELGKAMRAKVIAAVSSEEKAAFCNGAPNCKKKHSHKNTALTIYHRSAFWLWVISITPIWFDITYGSYLSVTSAYGYFHHQGNASVRSQHFGCHLILCSVRFPSAHLFLALNMNWRLPAYGIIGFHVPAKDLCRHTIV